MSRTVIIGGGWAGSAAALAARKAGQEVVLIEKTDMLLGAGNVGGIFRNNGRFTAAEEMKALGAGEMFDIMDACAAHTNIEFPGHAHASLYDVGKVEPAVREILQEAGVEFLLQSHVADAEMEDGLLKYVILNDGTKISGECFVEATGSSGPMGNCLKYGHGCSMCIQRCPTWGPRVSVSARCGVKDLVGRRENGTPGVFSGACKIDKKSLAHEVMEELNEKGLVILKVPEEDINYDKLSQKACKQYALKEYSENVILLDTGQAKLMTSYYPLEKLRRIPGLTKAEYVDPYSAGRGNSIRYLSVAPCLDTMQVEGIPNLFCGGEKGAALIGHTEAVVTGTLAGFNAASYAKSQQQLLLPDGLACGDIIAQIHQHFVKEQNYKVRYTFAGGDFFTRMKERGLYTTDVEAIRARVKGLGLEGVFSG